MIHLRILSKHGIDCFREYIHGLKDNPHMPRPDLNAEPYSQEFQPQVEIDETRTFPSRIEIGKYLAQCFEKAGIHRTDILDKRDLWTWLAYIWFDQLCPVLNGKRKVRDAAKYICSSDYTDYFRHYVANPYDIYSLHGDRLSSLFLRTPLNIVSDFVEVFACRQKIISNKNLVEVIHRLYWDNDSNRPKRGSVARTRPGHIRRLTKIIDQLELTYDIHIMSPDEILELLPGEFNGWKSI